MGRIVTWIGLLLALAPGPASSAVFSVGSGGACTHATLASAVAAAAANGAGMDEIKIGNSLTFAGPIDVTEQSLSIYGTTACDTDTLAIRTLSITSGDGFRMFGGASSLRTLDLARLTIIMTAGRTLAIQNHSYVILEADTLLSGGSAADGGNVSMSGPDVVLLIDTGASVYNGDATGNGGGVHCSGGGTIGLIDGSVHNNQADGNGGGLYLDGCLLNDFAGGPDIGDFGRSGIHTNRAEGSGGGIYATNGAEVNLNGTAEEPVTVRDNRAQNGAGGGILLTGAATFATAENAQIYDNFATSGGGVDVRNDASFSMERVGTDCSEPLECSTLSRNLLFARPAVGGHGGALSVTTGGTASIFQTYITGNDADEGGGVAWVNGANSFLRIEGSMLFANDAGTFDTLFDVSGGAQLVFAFNSTASNTKSGDVLAAVGTGSSAAFHANALGESAGGLVDDAPGTTSGSCNLALLVPTPLAWTGTTPASAGQLFRDPVVDGDLHLRRTAPAIDACSTAGYAPLRPDFDDEPRGFDQTAIADALGTFDAGADEYLPEPASAACAAVALLSLCGVRPRIRRRA